MTFAEQHYRKYQKKRRKERRKKQIDEIRNILYTLQIEPDSNCHVKSQVVARWFLRNGFKVGKSVAFPCTYDFVGYPNHIKKVKE